MPLMKGMVIKLKQQNSQNLEKDANKTKKIKKDFKINKKIIIYIIIALVIIQLVISRISLKSSTVRSILDGDPSVIIERGKVNFKEMLQQRYNLDDLLVQLRSRGIKSIEEVDYAILETSGKLSVFRKKDDKDRTYPLPVIIDGKIQKDALYQIGKDPVWLANALRREGYQLEDVFYGFYQKNRLFLIRKDAIK